MLLGYKIGKMVVENSSLFAQATKSEKTSGVKDSHSTLHAYMISIFMLFLKLM